MNSTVFSLLEALEKVQEDPSGERYAKVFKKDGLRAVLYAPQGHDPQRPHKEDETYVVVRGTATFTAEDCEPRAVAPGDLIFVPALKEHKFVDFSEEFLAWAIFAPPG